MKCADYGDVEAVASRKRIIADILTVSVSRSCTRKKKRNRCGKIQALQTLVSETNIGVVTIKQVLNKDLHYFIQKSRRT